ncbi:MAG TPA: DNA-directed RNA polymerase subunit beta', partial [Dehalococcoidales bacterium]|nr:DNA-directed RNA polymerase subunit beta' [Dehalococcoidales bacterium]
ASPVSHIWFSKGIPSRVGLLLDLSPRNLERVLYFSHYIITSINEDMRREAIEKLQKEQAQDSSNRQQAVEAKIEAEKDTTVEEANQMRRNALEEDSEAEVVATSEVERLRNMRVRNLLTENDFRDLSEKYAGMFEAGMGADAILKITRDINLDELRKELIEEGRSPSGQRRRKAGKRLQVVEAFRRSGNKPEWMILTVLPVLPPDLRPTVQLDGGRFAISDINDLYRRVINRNNRLHHLVEIGAPEIIIRNEKRMLQEAVDSLVDNGKRGQPVSVSGSHKLKSLSDMLRGKQGRFRQNLLGKRVDYSGRSVIVIGPELKLHQCGLPRRMALELFKPFVMRRLIEQGLAHNIKSARRQVEKAKPEVFDILEEVVKERPVLLNRAPTLHRLSIQAFEPVLIDGSAIQIHPLVCSAFNADFDGDQMAVHVPLSRAAVKGAREQMLSIHNMLLPSSGDPVVSPTLDMVLGCYYLTTIRPYANGTGKKFANFEEAKLAFEIGAIDLKAEIEVRDIVDNNKILKTSVGRIIFNECFPRTIGFRNQAVDKSSLKKIVADCARILNDEEMAGVMDRIKETGFKFATRSGTTIAMGDIEVPRAKAKLIAEAEARSADVEKQFEMGIITDEERYGEVVKIWNDTTEAVTKATQQNMDPFSGIYMMATSGAKGNLIQIRQMAGMRGLMTNPSGKIIDFPIKSSFSEGLSVLEYFISTHGARKGLADTALRTSESGYLTRRLVDVAHDIIIKENDCGSLNGLWIDETKDKDLLPPLADRIIGRLAAADIVDPKTGEILVARDEEFDDKKAAKITAAGVKQAYVRSPLTCQAKQGVCQKCYGRDLARGSVISMNTAVGIIAAQSIGEPGTQLTLRTFHTGGVVGLDITTGLPRVEELFEARSPKNQAVLSEISGKVEVIQDNERQTIRVVSSEMFRNELDMPEGWTPSVQNGQWVEMGTVIAGPKTAKKGKAAKAEAEAESQEVTAEPKNLMAPVAGTIVLEKGKIAIMYEEREERIYHVSATTRLRVQNGEEIKAGQQLTEGQLNPQDILNVSGREAAQRYLVDEVLKVYRSQGVNINDKHIEIIVRQML